MKKKLTASLFLFIFFISAVHVKAESPELNAIKEKTIKAAQYLSEKGKAVLSDFNDPEGEWVKDPYIFVYDMKGTIIGHANKNLVGKSFITLKDIKGKMFPAAFLAIAKSEKGCGWVDYWWPREKGGTPEQKVSYIMKVPGRDMLVGAGIYGYTEKDAVKELGE